MKILAIASSIRGSRLSRRGLTEYPAGGRLGEEKCFCSGPQAAALQDYVSRHGMSEHVKFLGRVDQASLLAAYRQADDIRSLNRELLDAATSSRVESAPAQLLDAA